MNIKQDIREFLAVTGWTAQRLSEEANVAPAIISRLVTDGVSARHGVHSSTLQKLFPFLYGDKRPLPPPTAPAPEARP